jgi:hypothetical protein
MHSDRTHQVWVYYFPRVIPLACKPCRGVLDITGMAGFGVFCMLVIASCLPRAC